MADLRFLVSWGFPTAKPEDRYSNTLYFVVDGSIPTPDYQTLTNDLLAIYRARSFCGAMRVEVRCYDMADETPRPELAFAAGNGSAGAPDGAAQIALCLSYYSERNLPRQRGRIYCGPYTRPAERPAAANQTELIAHANALAGLGGVNVDWSVYSPTKATLGEDPTMSISDVWVDNSWDVQRRRKLGSTSRVTATINE